MRKKDRFSILIFAIEEIKTCSCNWRLLVSIQTQIFTRIYP